MRFVRDAHGSIVSIADFPALAADFEKHGAMPVFQAISQVFIPPAQLCSFFSALAGRG
jgi:hypothetical protein